MSLPGLTEFLRQTARDALTSLAARLGPDMPLIAVDGTAGNGHDTLFLAGLLRELRGDNFHLLALDVQPAALEATRARLRAANLDRPGVRLVISGHELLGARLRALMEETRSPAAAQAGPPEPPGCAAVVCNLGFLPGSDKQIITRTGSTLAFLRGAAIGPPGLLPGGILAVHAYGGHPGGLEELEAVDRWCALLPPRDWQVVRYSVHNKPRNPEALFLVFRKGQRFPRADQ